MISSSRRPSMAGAFTLALGTVGEPVRLTDVQLPRMPTPMSDLFFFGGPGPIFGSLDIGIPFRLCGDDDTPPRTFAEALRHQRRARRRAKRARRAA